MREKVQQLIVEGRTEEALALLAQYNSEAVLLQARFNQAKKQQNMGLIDFGEWSRVLAQVNYAALAMASQINVVGGNNNIVISNTYGSTVNINRGATVVVFISDDELRGKSLRGKLRILFNKLEECNEDRDVTLEKLQRIVHLLFSNFPCAITEDLKDRIEEFELGKFKRKELKVQQQELVFFAEEILGLKEDLLKSAEEKRDMAEVLPVSALWVNFAVNPVKSEWDTLVARITQELNTARNKHLLPIWEESIAEMELFKEEILLWADKTSAVRKGIQRQIIEKMI